MVEKSKNERFTNRALYQPLPHFSSMPHLSTTMLGGGFYVAIPPWRSGCEARAPLSPVRSEPNLIDVPDREYSDGEFALIEDDIAEMLMAGTVIPQFEEHIFATRASIPSSLCRRMAEGIASASTAQRLPARSCTKRSITQTFLASSTLCAAS